MAKIGADRSGFTKETKAAEAEHKAFLGKVDGQKAKIDADTTAIDTKLGKTADTAKTTSTQINASFSAAWKSVVADLDKVEREAWQSGRAMDEAFTTGLRGAREQLDRLAKEGAETGADLQSELGRALLSVRNDAAKMRAQVSGEFDKVADDARDSGREAASGFSAELEDKFAEIGKQAGFLAAGGFIGQQLLAGLEASWEEDRVGTLITAQTSAASSAAGRLGDSAGDLFRSSFGESIEDAGRAITAVFQNDLIDEGAAVADVEKIASKVITVSGVIEEEFAAISRSAQQAVRTGLADNVEDALDMITHATQEGLNVAGDLLDTVDEYGTTFRKVGLEGAEAFGLLRQAQLGGARDTDVAADAIKEFGILTQDTASNASRGFQTLGLDGEKMGRMIAAGGSSADEALRLTLNALREMPAGLERNSAAVDLFGVKAEDMGDALFRMDLDTAAELFGDFGGSVDEAAEAMARGLPPMERFARGWDSMISDMIGSIAELNDVTEGLPEALQGFEGLDLFSPEQQDNVDKGAEAMDNAADSAEEAADATTTYAGTIDQLIEKQRELAGGAISLSEAHIKNEEAIVSAREALEEFAGEGVNKAKTGFDLTIEAGRELQGSLNSVASSTHDTIAAMREQGATSTEVAEYMKAQRVTFVELATGMGLSETAANALADALIGIPDKVVPRVGIQDAATPVLAAIKKRIDQMPKEVRTDYYLYTHYLQSGSASARNQNPDYGGYGGLAEGGVLEFYASGGLRPMSASNADIVQSHSRTGFMRVIADNPIADELFMPIIPTSARSQDLLDEGIRRMRPELAKALGLSSGGIVSGGYDSGYGAGTVVGMPAGSTRGGNTFNLYGPDANEVARRVLDMLRAEEALYGA